MHLATPTSSAGPSGAFISSSTRSADSWIKPSATSAGSVAPASEMNRPAVTPASRSGNGSGTFPAGIARLGKQLQPFDSDRGMLVFHVGGGPRTTAQIVAEIDFLIEHMDDFRRIQAAGGQYNINNMLAERRGEEYIGCGNAWGPDQGGGTVNTGAEEGSEKRLANFMRENRNALEHGYRRHNPVAESTLRSAFTGNDAPGDGTPTTARGALTRADQGLEERLSFSSKLKQIKEAFPSYQVTVLAKASVERIDLGRPHKPGVLLVDAATNDALGTIRPNFVRLNTGTTLVSPVSDPAVMRHSFVQPMDPVAVDKFLAQRGLLDEARMLKPGTRLALGGTNLSAYDQIIALQRAMTLLERDDDSTSGYRVTDSAKANYQGAITFISNTAGKWIPPRHVNKACAWTQKTEPLGNSHELHAAFLHDQGQKVFQDWHLLMAASIASALDMLPDQIAERGYTTKQLLARQHERTRQHTQKMDESAKLGGQDRQEKIDEAMQTLEGARRQAFLQAILGLGMATDIDASIRRMEGDAPLTFRGRVGYPMHRAQQCAVTTVDEKGNLPENIELNATLAQWMNDVLSSPVRVHELAYMLFEAGIATHMPGSYSDLAAKANGSKALSFTSRNGQTRTFDAFIVSPTFKRNAEPAIASLASQVEPVHPSIPDLGKVTSHRRVITAQGVPSNLQDFSLNGKGGIVPGTRSLVGAFALDVNNRESATEVAVPMAFFRMAIEHMAAAGVPEPIREVEKLYARLQPDRGAFDNEVRSFERHYESLTAKAAFVQQAQKAAAADAALFASLARQARSGSRVSLQAAWLEQLSKPGIVAERRAQALRESSARFADALAERERFKPVSRDAFLQRFVDIPLHVHEEVYREAHKRALRHAEGEAPSP